MKVIEGKFGEAEKDPVNLKELMQVAVECSEMAEETGVKFCLILEKDDVRNFLTNHSDPADAAWAMNQVKFAMLAGGLTSYE